MTESFSRENKSQLYNFLPLLYKGFLLPQTIPLSSQGEATRGDNDNYLKYYEKNFFSVFVSLPDILGTDLVIAACKTSNVCGHGQDSVAQRPEVRGNEHC
jgi:hypothetical protein